MADKLSMDSSAALAAGMSYGQWKALHPHTSGTAHKRKKKEQIICAFCGKPFDVGHGRKYCSFDCYSQKNAIAARERYKAKRGGATE